MTTLSLLRQISARLSGFGRSVVVALGVLVLGGASAADDLKGLNLPLRIAVYYAPPYGLVEPDGSIDGVSVDLWRRAAAVMGREYRFVPVSQMEAILAGLEHNSFDAAIGAITITPERVGRVDFSYPAHRSGVAVAVRKDSGAMAAIGKYGAIVTELSPLVAFTAALLSRWAWGCG
jgi:polar amino acid transport system substrate-binding protein